MPNWQWLPVPWSRFFEPYLSSLSAPERARVEAGLEKLRQDPLNDRDTYPWKGREDVNRPPRTTRTAIVDGPRPGEYVEAIYAPFVDYPLLGAIALYPLEPPGSADA